MKLSLNGTWRLYCTDDPEKYDLPAEVPGSLYSALLAASKMEDPYYMENEFISTDICRDSCAFEKIFDLDDDMLSSERVLLKFYGIDTVSQIVLNGKEIGSTDNMHREYVFDVTGITEQSGNVLTVKIYSPIKYIEERNAVTPLWGVASTMAGYPHIRKAHYMFGWDWGPKLPDMGIWRDVELIGVRGGLIDGIYVRQDHSKLPENKVTVTAEVTLSQVMADEAKLTLSLSAPDGRKFTDSVLLQSGENKTAISFTVDDPELWYPRGYGSQPLYRLTAELSDNADGEIFDSRELNVGLRTVRVSCNPLPEGGKEFAFEVNGIKIFAMGANYIPEDQIISRCTPEKTKRLLNQCRRANFNMIRIWGGGYYPDDSFYDCCDRMGLLVWQDFMFACSVYKADVPFCETVKEELICNIKRIRNHPSLAIWCGNNEIESMWQYWSIDADSSYKKDYLRLFEALIPKTLKAYDPDRFYWPSSPSSGGSFDESSAEDRGDSHYWAVWHGLRPFTDYFNYRYRFCSEFGFESLPSIKTIRSFAEEHDLDLCGRVMEAHQKCEQGTEKIMYYLAQLSNYPYDFEGLIYASQIVQSDAVRLNIEHMRRSRGVCMGALYWQVNDSNPVISWSSVDYFHRPKALHYRARHFYAPVLLSADTQDKGKIRLNISSERQYGFNAVIGWRSRKNTGEIIASGEKEVTVNPLSAEYFVTLTPLDTLIDKGMEKDHYIEFTLTEKGRVISEGTCMLVPPKSFDFADPALSVKISEEEDRFGITVSARTFAKGVCLDLKTGDCIFSDNWFDIHKGSVTVFVKKSALHGISARELSKELTAVSYYEALKLKK